MPPSLTNAMGHYVNSSVLLFFFPVRSLRVGSSPRELKLYSVLMGTVEPSHKSPLQLPWVFPQQNQARGREASRQMPAWWQQLYYVTQTSWPHAATRFHTLPSQVDTSRGSNHGRNPTPSLLALGWGGRGGTLYPRCILCPCRGAGPCKGTAICRWDKMPEFLL